MKKYVCVIAILTGLPSFGFQFPNPEFVKHNKDKKLIVVLKDMDDLKEVELAADIRENFAYTVETYNTGVKDLFPKNWKASTGEVIFMTRAEMGSLTDDDYKNSLFLVSYYKSIKDPLGRELDMYHWNVLFFDQKLKRQNYFYLIYEADQIIDSADIIFFIQQANNNVSAALNGLTEYKEIIDLEKTVEIISQKTLLIEQGLTTSTKEELINKYTGKLEITSTKEIDNAIMTNNEDILYIKMIYGLGAGGFGLYGLFDASNGQIIGVASSGGFKVYIAVGEKKHFLSRVENAGIISYEYTLNMNRYMGSREIWSIYKSKIDFKEVHLNVLMGTAQKMNFKFLDS